MIRRILALSILPSAAAQAAEGSGSTTTGLLVIAILGVAVWLSMPAKRKPRATPRHRDTDPE